MTTTSTAAAIVLALVSTILASVASAPITQATPSRDMYTCRDLDRYSTKDWRACSNEGEMVSYDDLDIPNKLLRNEIESFQVPEK